MGQGQEFRVSDGCFKRSAICRIEFADEDDLRLEINGKPCKKTKQEGALSCGDLFMDSSHDPWNRSTTLTYLTSPSISSSNLSVKLVSGCPASIHGQAEILPPVNDLKSICQANSELVEGVIDFLPGTELSKWLRQRHQEERAFEYARNSSRPLPGFVLSLGQMHFFIEMVDVLAGAGLYDKAREALAFMSDPWVLAKAIGRIAAAMIGTGAASDAEELLRVYSPKQEGGHYRLQAIINTVESLVKLGRLEEAHRFVGRLPALYRHSLKLSIAEAEMEAGRPSAALRTARTVTRYGVPNDHIRKAVLLSSIAKATKDERIFQEAVAVAKQLKYVPGRAVALAVIGFDKKDDGLVEQAKALVDRISFPQLWEGSKQGPIDWSETGRQRALTWSSIAVKTGGDLGIDEAFALGRSLLFWETKMKMDDYPTLAEVALEMASVAPDLVVDVVPKLYEHTPLGWVDEILFKAAVAHADRGYFTDAARVASYISDVNARATAYAAVIMRLCP